VQQQLFVKPSVDRPCFSTEALQPATQTTSVHNFGRYGCGSVVQRVSSNTTEVDGLHVPEPRSNDRVQLSSSMVHRRRTPDR